VAVQLGAWGSASLKPVWIYANTGYLDKLKKKKNPKRKLTTLCHVYKDGKGRLRCVGKATLKKSQSMPHPEASLSFVRGLLHGNPRHAKAAVFLYKQRKPLNGFDLHFCQL
jgi:hypothetical protein